LISEGVNINTLMIFWQFTLKGIDEMSIVANQILSLEMLIFRLIHLKEMPDYKEVLNLINQKENFSKSATEIGPNDFEKKKYLNFEKVSSKTSTEQMKNIIQTKSEFTSAKPNPTSKNLELESVKTFEDLIKIVSKKKEVELKFDLEKNVNLVKFSEGKIDISINEKLGKNFIRNLSEKLFQWTAKRWVISLTRDKGDKTYVEQNLIKKNDMLEKEKKEKVYQDFKKNFPDAELIEVLKKD